MTAVNEVIDEQPAPPAEAAEQDERRGRRFGAADGWSLLSYAVLAVWVVFQLWRDPNGRVLWANRDDHGLTSILLAHGERIVFHGDNPFFTDRLNAPGSINMMANTSMLALGIPMAPITHFLGVGVTVAFLITLGLAGTAAGWYWVLSRHLVKSRVAAWIGGLWAGFAPAMISHANGHVNFVSAWLIPFIVLQVIRLREPGRIWRGGVSLALLVVAQVFINEEGLLFTALTLVLFVLGYALMAPRRALSEARYFIPGAFVAAGFALALLAYPLYVQFKGAGSYHGQPFEPDKYVTDLAAIPAFARQSLFGYAKYTRELSVSATEDDSFFGPVGALMILVSMAVLWRSAAARAAGIAGVLMLVASLGPRLVVHGRETGVKLPFALVSHLPVIDLVSVTRFAMVTGTVAGVLIAMATDRVPGWPKAARIAFRAGLVLAMVPLFPKPLPIVGAVPVPAFLTEGTYKPYVVGDRTVVTIPTADVTSGRTGEQWAAKMNLAYKSPRGYFMGPENAPESNQGSWQATPRWTSTMLRWVWASGKMPTIDDGARQRIRDDLTYWRAGVVVLTPDNKYQSELRTVMVEALGEPQLVGGVEIWDVRYLPVPSRG